MSKLMNIIKKYGREDAIYSFENEYFLAYPEKEKIYKTSCHRAAKDALEYFKIPTNDEEAYNAFVESIRKEIQENYCGLPLWYGIKGIRFDAHDWGDSMIEYEGEVFHACEVEDYLWDLYNEEHPAPDYQNQKEYDLYSKAFVAYMKQSEDVVKDELNSLILGRSEE